MLTNVVDDAEEMKSLNKMESMHKTLKTGQTHATMMLVRRWTTWDKTESVARFIQKKEMDADTWVVRTTFINYY